MIEILESILSGHNQFASGGLLLMIVGGIGVYFADRPADVLALDRAPDDHDDQSKRRGRGVDLGEGMVSSTGVPEKDPASGSGDKNSGRESGNDSGTGPTLVLARWAFLHHLLL